MRCNSAGVVFNVLLLAGCGRYDKFILPPAPGPAVDAVSWEWSDAGAPVLGRGAGGEFDSVDALNPSIVEVSGKLWNFYSGWDGSTWQTGVATSADGLHWHRRGRLWSPDPHTWEGSYIAANGTTLYQGEFRHWYQAGAPPRIGLARSSDGRNWSKHPAPILEPGPRGAWDERGVADPYVIEAGGRFYLFYLGQDRARRQRLGVAVSVDGVQWTKLRTNPILELGSLGAFDEIGLGEPAVWGAYGRWWMLYTGRDRQENRKTGLAVSTDGVHWTRVARPLLAGAAGWNSKVLCDPEVLALADGSYRVWYGGGDRPQPAENLNGQIGTGILRPVWPSSR